jgi:CRISPR-associated endoribonuclease Cas6
MSRHLLNSGFSVGIFRFTLIPREVLFVPAVNKANMLRGAFGHAFRRLCCVPQCASARECPLAESCPYKTTFEPSPPPDADRLSRNQDIPRPFMFRAPASDKTKFQPGEEFEFGLVLIGRAIESLPYFVLAFREVAAQGIGLNRAKCELREVKEVLDSDVPSSAAQIYAASDQVFRSPRGVDVERWMAGRLAAFPRPLGKTRIRFLSPTHIKSENQVVRSPDFHHVFKRLRDRINALSTFYGSGPLDADFAGLGARAGHVHTVASHVRWEERSRTSSKTHQQHGLSGFVGEAVYEGELDEFLPWLMMGELVHLGKHTAWGMGQIQAAKI